MFIPKRLSNRVYIFVFKIILLLHFITIEMTSVAWSHLKDVVENWFYNIYSLKWGLTPNATQSLLLDRHLKKSECTFFRFQQHQPHHPMIVYRFDVKLIHANIFRLGGLPQKRFFFTVFNIVTENNSSH